MAETLPRASQPFIEAHLLCLPTFNVAAHPAAEFPSEMGGNLRPEVAMY